MCAPRHQEEVSWHVLEAGQKLVSDHARVNIDLSAAEQEQLSCSAARTRVFGDRSPPTRHKARDAPCQRPKFESNTHRLDNVNAEVT